MIKAYRLSEEKFKNQIEKLKKEKEENISLSANDADAFIKKYKIPQLDNYTKTEFYTHFSAVKDGERARQVLTAKYKKLKAQGSQQAPHDTDKKFQDELAAKELSIKNLRKEIDDLSSMTCRLEEKVAEKEAEIEALQQKQKDEKRTAYSDEQIAGFQAQLNMNIKKINELETEKQILEESFNLLKNKLKKNELTIKKLEEDKQTLKDNSVDTISLLVKDLEEKETEINKLKDEPLKPIIISNYERLFLKLQGFNTQEKYQEWYENWIGKFSGLKSKINNLYTQYLEEKFGGDQNLEKKFSGFSEVIEFDRRAGNEIMYNNLVNKLGDCFDDYYN
jgi:chromosome segregation ATPase